MKAHLWLKGAHSPFTLAVLLLSVAAVIAARKASHLLVNNVVFARGCSRSMVVLADALEPLDDPRLDLKLSASPAALAHSPVAWRVACARVMARSARVAYAFADEKNAEMAGAVLRPSVDPEHDCGLF